MGRWKGREEGVCVKGGQVTHHLSGFECFSVKVCQTGAFFLDHVTVLQLLSATRGSVLVSVLHKKGRTGSWT